jgi:hypothetical protein
MSGSKLGKIAQTEWLKTGESIFLIRKCKIDLIICKNNYIIEE